MPESRTMVADGNEAVAMVAHRTNEVIVIYPITPSSAMGEFADQWSAKGQTNVWGTVPRVVEMQSEGGAIGCVHGSLQTGCLATTFTSSQGLLLMIPNLYKIAGELTPFCLHVAARTVATHALSIFGDHSDVMACRQTGVAMLCSSSVQEAHDLACIGQAATLRSRIPVLHFFDGFRTSHEVGCFDCLNDDELWAMIPHELIEEHRQRALSPDHPVLRGTAQNPDTFFQAREACNTHYDRFAGILDDVFDEFAQLTGRRYSSYEYFGDEQAQRVIILMGSGVETARQYVEWANGRGDRIGLIQVRMYRPFDLTRILAALPSTVRSIAVLDRTKEPGAVGEPMYVDFVTAITRARQEGLSVPTGLAQIVGGRYGLSSKEFTPAMVASVFDELKAKQPRNGFTVGIVDDVTHRSLEFDASFDIEPADEVRCVFIGLGADGTVSANKNSIKIIGTQTANYAQGYFVYDSKKSGAMTVSHVRFGPRPINSPYLIDQASFVACHQFSFLERLDVLEYAAPGATFLLDSPYGVDEVWAHLPREVQAEIIEKKLKFHVINARHVADKSGMGGRINTIMQTCFFALSGVLPPEQAIEEIKKAISTTYGSKGDEIVRRNWAAVDAAIAALGEVHYPETVTSSHARVPLISEDAPEFVRRVTQVMLAGKGDLLPVSAFPIDGTWPVGSARWEKRGIAGSIPLWEDDLCIQCNKCAFVCPHAAIRAKAYEPESLNGAPGTFLSQDYRAPDLRGLKYTIQVAPDDCTGCELCVKVCPAKDKSNPRRKAINMAQRLPVLDRERQRFDFFMDLPPMDRTRKIRLDVKGTQFYEPLFEFSGACAGCGETPYVKLLTQLFGDRAIIANATGCSSIYGGNLPTTPYTTDCHGRGPAWSNSLFEDNAEFGLGMRLSVDALRELAVVLLHRVAPQLGETLVTEIAGFANGSEQDFVHQRQAITALREQLRSIETDDARRLSAIADSLVHKSIWLVGGDGWAYDIGYGGLDHVLSMEHDVNILVLDTEVYSNTGGQASKATPLGAAAKFASMGKSVGKKDLGLIAMSYGHVYVASVAFGANDNHTVKAFREAEDYSGPSLIIAYSHCIAHGYDMMDGVSQQAKAVQCGIWPLYRFDPRRLEGGEHPLMLDAKPGKIPVTEYTRGETRFRMVERLDPARFRNLARRSQELAQRRISVYQHLAQLAVPKESPKPESEPVGAGTGEEAGS